MHTITLADLLHDMRWTALRVRASELDHNGEHLIDLGLAERVGQYLFPSPDGLDVLDACRDVVLPEAT